jgi:hypothetical protein
MDEAASVELAAARNGNRDKPGRRLRPLLLNTENPLENISTANGDRM